MKAKATHIVLCTATRFVRDHEHTSGLFLLCQPTNSSMYVKLHGTFAASSALYFRSSEVSTEIVAEESPGEDASITIG